MAIPYLACMALVASFYRLPPRVLPSIHAVEGGRPGTVSHNLDGSDDLGVMQINSRWIQPLARYIGESDISVRARLIQDPCFNIAAAGAIMRTYMIESHGDLMRAIGFYHSHTPALSQDYRINVTRMAAALFGAAAPAP
jgi:hypothetical protein